MANNSISENTMSLKKKINLYQNEGKFRVIHPVRNFFPSDIMKAAQLNNFKNADLAKMCPVFRDYLKSETLNSENNYKVLKILLQIDDLTNMLPYMKLKFKGIKIELGKFDNKFKYYIDKKSLPKNIEDIISPMFDEIVVAPINFLNKTKFKYEVDALMITNLICGRITRISENTIYFELPGNDASIVPTKYDILFRPSRIPYRFQYEALELLKTNNILLNYLFPKIVPNRSIEKLHTGNSLQLVNATIASNPEQLTAVHTIVKGSNKGAPYIVFGPPGTGKTTTIVEAVLQLYLNSSQNRILVTAGSNSACDTIALRLCQYFNESTIIHENTGEQPLIRIYSESVVERTKEKKKRIDPLLHRYSNFTEKVEDFKFPDNKTIREFRIIVVTLCIAGKLVSGDVGVNEFFTHVFIDEAGASTETECLVGIMGIKTSENCQVVLSGDHKQLGAVIKSERAKTLGLGLSLMERLLSIDCYELDENGGYDKSLQARLIRNYRSHPAIVSLFNQLYYDNKLIAAAKDDVINLASNWQILKNSKFPIIFQPVHGNLEKKLTSTSAFNFLEIRVLMKYVDELLSNGIEGKEVKLSDIGIITPYKLQACRIKNELKKKDWNAIETGSVEYFQGQEKPIIIASMVRSFTHVGFVANPRRINVILSRPQSLLILVGNPNTLQQSHDFKFIIDKCKSKGTFLPEKKINLTKSRKKNQIKKVTASMGKLSLNAVPNSTQRKSIVTWNIQNCIQVKK